MGRLQCKQAQGSCDWDSSTLGCCGRGDGDDSEAVNNGRRAADFRRASVGRSRPYQMRRTPSTARDNSTHAHAAGTPIYSRFSAPSCSRLSTADRSPTVGVRVGGKTDHIRPATADVSDLVSASTLS